MSEMLNKPEQQLSVVGKDGDMELLIEISRFEDKADMKPFDGIGWSWRHVRIWPTTLERLYRLGYLDQKLNSSSYLGYRLNDTGRKVIYGKNRQKSEGQIEQEVLEIRLANVRRNTARDIVERLRKLGNRNDVTTVGELIDAITNTLIIEYKLDDKKIQGHPS